MLVVRSILLIQIKHVAAQFIISNSDTIKKMQKFVSKKLDSAE